MKLSPSLIPATLLRRYKRFLADVRLMDGSELTVHTPNTGRMLGCAEPGSRIWLRDTKNIKRRYRYSWEMSETKEGQVVGVHTGITTNLVVEAITHGVLTQLQGYQQIQREVPYGREHSRVDLLLQDPGTCYIEIKNVTASLEPGIAIFPDAVSARGTRHLRELMHVVSRGERAVILFCVQRGDVSMFQPADTIDPVYGQTLRDALDVGVEAIACRCRVNPDEVVITETIPVHCP